MCFFSSPANSPSLQRRFPANWVTSTNCNSYHRVHHLQAKRSISHSKLWQPNHRETQFPVSFPATPNHNFSSTFCNLTTSFSHFNFLIVHARSFKDKVLIFYNTGCRGKSFHFISLRSLSGLWLWSLGRWIYVGHLILDLRVSDLGYGLDLQTWVLFGGKMKLVFFIASCNNYRYITIAIYCNQWQ